MEGEIELRHIRAVHLAGDNDVKGGFQNGLP